MSWGDIDSLRNSLAYEPEPISRVKSFADMARERSRIAMLKPYAKRRRLGLNAHGKPYKAPHKINKRYETN